MKDIKETKEILNYTEGFGDWVVCNNCGEEMITKCGAEICPHCGSNGTFSWAHETYNLPTDFQEISKEALEELGRVVKDEDTTPVFEVTVTHTFTGRYVVRANSVEEAKEKIMANCGGHLEATFGTVKDELVDYEVETKPDSEVTYLNY